VPVAIGVRSENGKSGTNMEWDGAKKSRNNARHGMTLGIFAQSGRLSSSVLPLRPPNLLARKK